MLDAADVTFDLIWRSGAGDTILTTVTHHFDVPAAPHQFDAVTFETDSTGIAAAAKAGDQLVLRFTVKNATPGTAFIPNGDGDKTNGRIPSVRLPP